MAILTEPSLSQSGIVLFLVTQLIAFTGLPVYTFAASTLWHSNWYDLIARKLTVPLLPAWAMSLSWLVYHESVALGLFFLMKDFTNFGAHHPADYGFVIGWLLGGIGAGILYPMAVTSFCNLIPAALAMLGAFVGITVSFGIQLQYTGQDAPRHLEINDPSPWLLIWPVLWLLYNTLIAVDMAVISTRDEDYIARCAIERGVVTSRKRNTEAGNVAANMQEALLQPNPSRESSDGQVTIQTIMQPAVAMVSNQQHRRDAKGQYRTYDGYDH
jgi:hypothetical protein